MLFKASHDLNATVDILVVTHGEGGFAHSFPANYVYHYDLNNETIARKRLVKIRTEEMACACSVVMCRNLYFLRQPDVQYTTNVTEVLAEWWNSSKVVCITFSCSL